MRTPRLRITDSMAIVAITALEFGMFVALLRDAMTEDDRSRSGPAWYLILGALPMAYIWAVVLLMAYRRRAGGLFLLGFGGFGGMGLAGYYAMANLHPEIIGEYLWSFLQHLPYPHAHPPWSFPLVLLASVIVLVLPQLLFALLCGVILSGALVRGLMSSEPLRQ